MSAEPFLDQDARTDKSDPAANIGVIRQRRRSDLLIHELDGEALLYDAVRADTHRLNETAYFIWQCCDGRLSADDITHELAERYDVSESEAHKHVLRMLEMFRARELVAETVTEMSRP